mgnify:CR=1 FL=1
MRGRISALVAAATMLVGCNLPASSGSQAAAAADCKPGEQRGLSDAGLKQVTLCVDSDGKSHAYSVEMAVSPQEQARGLMFRTELADDSGMLFPYAAPQTLSFWMKNTYIPLDIIFIREDGNIENIAANTVPYSLDPVKSEGPAIAVLEIRGGLAAELGIKAGDKVRWK